MITTKTRFLRIVQVGTKTQAVYGTIYDAQRVEREMSAARAADIWDARSKQLQVRRRLQAA